MRVDPLCTVPFDPDPGHMDLLKSGGRIMVSAVNEVPRRVECGEGCSIPNSYAPYPEFLFDFWQMASFGALWELILLQLNCLSYTHKPVSLWLVKPAIASLCVKKVGGRLHDCPQPKIWGTCLPVPLWICHGPDRPTVITAWPALVAEWLMHSAAMCSRAWRAQWPGFDSARCICLPKNYF